MPRYIDADKLLDRVSDVSAYYEEGREVKDEIVTIITDFPAADVEEVRHGEWEDDADDVYWGNYIVKKHCSECGYTPTFDRETELFDLTKRCPNCGAKMDRKENGDAKKIELAIGFYDQEEIYENCTVQILTNSKTGETSIGWWKNED